jgi:hypothetical protein
MNMVDVIQKKGDVEKINDRLRPSNEHHASTKVVTQPMRHAHAVHHSGSQGHHGGAMTNPPGSGRDSK